MGFGTMYGNIMGKTCRDKPWVFGTLYGNIMKKKLLEIKLGFWVNVQKYNGKKNFRVIHSEFFLYKSVFHNLC